MRNYLQKRNEGEFNVFDSFGRLFDDLFTPSLQERKYGLRTDVKETEKGYELKVEAPGFDKKDISLTLENGYLTVKAEKSEKEKDDEKYIRKESSYSYERSYYLGENVSEKDISARYENGILSVDVNVEKEKEIPSHNIEIL